MSSIKLTNEVELAPVRRLDDFLLDKARFQIPPYKDLQKWSNRIVSNLLYYQTNYFAMILTLFLLVSLVHPREMLLGFLSICLAFAVFAYSTSKHPEAVEFKKNHPLISLAVIVAAGYFLVCVIGSVVTFMFGIALPLLLIIVHASLRLRNLANKVSNKIEAAGLKKTIMGRMFDILGLEIELINID